jgi:hypothetical protein
MDQVAETGKPAANGFLHVMDADRCDDDVVAVTHDFLI